MPICDLINAIFSFLIGTLGLSFLDSLASFLLDSAGCDV